MYDFDRLELNRLLQDAPSHSGERPPYCRTGKTAESPNDDSVVRIASTEDDVAVRVYLHSVRWIAQGSVEVVGIPPQRMETCDGAHAHSVINVQFRSNFPGVPREFLSHPTAPDGERTKSDFSVTVGVL
jgi:hypothetical protein